MLQSEGLSSNIRINVKIKINIVIAVVFPVVMYGCEIWTIMKAEHWIDAFELWGWRRLLRAPWTARRSNQSILKEINPEYSLEGLVLKLQYFGHLMWRANSLEKYLMLGKVEGKRIRGQQRMRWLDCITGSMHTLLLFFNSVWLFAKLFATPCTAACEASLSFIISQSLPKFMSIALVMPSSHPILWHPLLLLPSIFPSIRDFYIESAVHIRWTKYCSFNFSINPSNEYSGLISLKIDWSNLLAVQGSLRSLHQHHCLKASILQHSTFFTVQLSQPYMTTGKNVALTINGHLLAE